MNPSYSHVVFDLDGTRIDLSQSILAALQACGLCVLLRRT